MPEFPLGVAVIAFVCRKASRPRFSGCPAASFLGQDQRKIDAIFATETMLTSCVLRKILHIIC